MKNNKEKIDALIKKYFNAEYYNLKNRIESSLDEIAKSDNATKNFETNIENAIKENKHDVRNFDKIVIDVFKTLKNKTSNYDYEYDTDNSQKSDTKGNSNDVENKISNLEDDLKNAAQRIQEAKLNKNDKLYVQARAEFSSLVKEISKLKNQNNLQKSTVHEFIDFSTLFNLNGDNLTNYSSGNSNDNPITSDDNTEEDVEKLDLGIDKNKKEKNDKEEKEDEKTEEEKQEERKQKIKKTVNGALVGALGGAIGFGLSFVFKPGTAGMVISVGRLAYYTSKKVSKSLKIYTEKHKDDELHPIVKIAGKLNVKAIEGIEKGKEQINELLTSIPVINSFVYNVNNVLKKPETQVFLNGMAVGYTIGKISQAVYKKYEASATEKNVPTEKSDIGDDKNIRENPSKKVTTSDNFKGDSVHNQPHTEVTKIDTATKFDPSKPVDLSSIKNGYVSSYSSDPVSLMTSAGKGAFFDKVNVVDGKTWVHFTQANGAGYAWFPAEDVMDALNISDISELTGKVSGGMHL